jgi:hypothetical protein
MSKANVRTLIWLAALCWLVVGGYGFVEAIANESGDDWEVRYSIFAISLMLGSILTVGAVVAVTRRSERPALRSIGLVVCGLGVVTTFVAWALPLWMTVLAIGFAFVAASGSGASRRAVASLAVAQLLGMAAMFVGIAAEVGPIDEYGDHPAAFGIGLVVTALGTLVSLFQIDRSVEPAPKATPTRIRARAQ